MNKPIAAATSSSGAQAWPGQATVAVTFAFFLPPAFPPALRAWPDFANRRGSHRGRAGSGRNSLGIASRVSGSLLNPSSHLPHSNNNLTVVVAISHFSVISEGKQFAIYQRYNFTAIAYQKS